MMYKDKIELLPWQQKLWERLARQLRRGRVPHALLLTGLPGLGKAQFSRYLAMAWLCEQPGEDATPCGACHACQWVQGNTHPDFRLLAPEEGKTEIGVPATRSMIDGLLLTGNRGRRVALVQPADAMNRASANALLKTLEEPPGGVLLLLVSALPHRLPATIVSRAQELSFVPPARKTALQWLRDQADDGRESAEEALLLSGGAPLRALALMRAEALERRRGLREDLINLARGRAQVCAVAASWARQPLAELLETFGRWLSLAARQDGSSPLQPALPGPRLKGVHVLYAEVNQVRAALTSQLRADLMLERVLIQWVQLTTAPEGNAQ